MVSSQVAGFAGSSVSDSCIPATSLCFQSARRIAGKSAGFCRPTGDRVSPRDLCPKAPESAGLRGAGDALRVDRDPLVSRNQCATHAIHAVCSSPLLDVSVAGLVLHVIQIPYRALNWWPVAWLGRISYSLYLWQELFCSNAALHWDFWVVVPALAC